MKVPEGYTSINMHSLMDLLEEMFVKTTLKMFGKREKDMRMNPTLHMINGLVNFMLSIDNSGKHFMSVPSFCFGGKAQKKARSSINIQKNHWIVNRAIRNKLLVAEEL